jgi:hypothetical protein
LVALYFCSLILVGYQLPLPNLSASQLPHLKLVHAIAKKLPNDGFTSLGFLPCPVRSWLWKFHCFPMFSGRFILYFTQLF